MKTDTKRQIIEYITLHKQVRVPDLVDYLNITPRAIFKQLQHLLAEEQISKTGKPPKVFFSIKQKTAEAPQEALPESLNNIIEHNFYWITPLGETENGVNGFAKWCTKFKLDFKKTAFEYEKTIDKYNQYKTDGLINGMTKMHNTFTDVFLDDLYYLDFYAIERFGKTKLGQLLLYAKQSQNRAQIKLLVEEIRPKIQYLLTLLEIDAVGFIPPTVKREVQLMSELAYQLKLIQPKISIIKIKTPIIIPQKTLNNLSDRTENARRTLIVNERNSYHNILLIDDAVGSGATLNETARQIKEKNICKNRLIGLSITGSFKGFDVISEV